MTEAIVDLDAGEAWGTETITLKHPFRLRGVTYAEVEMRTPTGLDMTRFYGAKGNVVDFALGLTQIDSVVFGAMHGVDSAAIIVKALGFLPGAPETSPK